MAPITFSQRSPFVLNQGILIDKSEKVSFLSENALQQNTGHGSIAVIYLNAVSVVDHPSLRAVTRKADINVVQRPANISIVTTTTGVTPTTGCVVPALAHAAASEYSTVWVRV